ncbi:ATP synthase F0 subunit B [Seleniivibrio sp.]|uniref:ATP synthase F0 subunit B n=1 Tax=Seleniivibrio sp. TaxID=2898801 RepID=UPI0025F27382|nr:ATP synthase F0 subunit B [Seleniivibrio sp.]MCD8552772.1 ATP synthase F0 subunit B [Seleniivibrio sp.]
MLYIDYTLAIQIVQFLVIIFIGKKMILDPVMGTVNSRDSKIEGMKQEAEGLKAKVEQYKADYTEKMVQMRAELADHHKKLKDAASKEAAEKIAAVKADVDAKILSARTEIQSESAKAKAEMDSMIKEISDLIADRIMLSA